MCRDATTVERRRRTCPRSWRAIVAACVAVISLASCGASSVSDSESRSIEAVGGIADTTSIEVWRSSAETACNTALMKLVAINRTLDSGEVAQADGLRLQAEVRQELANSLRDLPVPQNERAAVDLLVDELELLAKYDKQSADALSGSNSLPDYSDAVDTPRTTDPGFSCGGQR